MDSNKFIGFATLFADLPVIYTHCRIYRVSPGATRLANPRWKIIAGRLRLRDRTYTRAYTKKKREVKQKGRGEGESEANRITQMFGRKIRRRGIAMEILARYRVAIFKQANVISESDILILVAYIHAMWKSAANSLTKQLLIHDRNFLQKKISELIEKFITYIKINLTWSLNFQIFYYKFALVKFKIF